MLDIATSTIRQHNGTESNEKNHSNIIKNEKINTIKTGSALLVFRRETKEKYETMLETHYRNTDVLTGQGDHDMAFVSQHRNNTPTEYAWAKNTADSSQQSLSALTLIGPGATILVDLRQTYRTRDEYTHRFKPKLKDQGRVYSQVSAKHIGPGTSVFTGSSQT